MFFDNNGSPRESRRLKAKGSLFCVLDAMDLEKEKDVGKPEEKTACTMHKQEDNVHDKIANISC